MTPEDIARSYVPYRLPVDASAMESTRAFHEHLVAAILAQHLELFQIERALLDYALAACAAATGSPVRGLPPSISDGLETPREWYRREILHEGWGHPSPHPHS